VIQQGIGACCDPVALGRGPVPLVGGVVPPGRGPVASFCGLVSSVGDGISFVCEPVTLLAGFVTLVAVLAWLHDAELPPRTEPADMEADGQLQERQSAE
jgi:hypothetical protein